MEEDPKPGCFSSILALCKNVNLHEPLVKLIFFRNNWDGVKAGIEGRVQATILESFISYVLVFDHYH